jgi:hypothetical protein
MALSLPPVQSVSDTDDDSTVSLSLLQEAIVGDAVSWCELRIEVASAGVPWTAGDTVSIWVYEDDITEDDLVWTSSFTVTAAEVSSGLVDRTFDCSGMIDDDGGQGNSEVYAEAEVNKDDCGFFCAADRPKTANAIVQWVVDDASEDDDTSNEAVPVFPGATADRISSDGADWISFDLAGVSQVECTVVHDPEAGRIDATLLDATQTPVGLFQWQTDATVASETLSAGTYFVVISPAPGIQTSTTSSWPSPLLPPCPRSTRSRSTRWCRGC